MNQNVNPQLSKWKDLPPFAELSDEYTRWFSGTDVLASGSYRLVISPIETWDELTPSVSVVAVRMDILR